MTNNFVSKALSNHKVVNKNSSYICPDCKTELKISIAENENCTCPICGEKLSYRTTTPITENESRYICPRCNSTYSYEKNNLNSCPICEANMTVFVPKNSNKNDKS